MAGKRDQKKLREDFALLVENLLKAPNWISLFRKQEQDAEKERNKRELMRARRKQQQDKRKAARKHPTSRDSS